MVAGETRVFRSGAWKRRGRDDIAPGSFGTGGKLTLEQREALVAGAFTLGADGAVTTKASPVPWIPNPNSVGLLPGWSISMLTPLLPQPGQHHVTLPAGITQNVIIFGEVRPASGATPSILKNSVILGMDPDLIPAAGGYPYGTATQLVRSWSELTAHYVIQDCLFDAFLWGDPTVMALSGAPAGGPRTDLNLKLRQIAAIKGGRGTILRCDIRHAQDGAQLQQPARNDQPSVPRFNMIGCRIRDILYYRGPGHNQPEGTHADALQFQLGGGASSHYKIYCNWFGGTYDPVGFAATPAYNSGETYYNTGIILKQESWNLSGGVSDRVNREIENVDIRWNIFEGGRNEGFDFNFPYNPTYPNDFDTTTIRDNWFVERADGDYINRTLSLDSRFSNNNIIEWTERGVSFSTVGPAPKRNG